MILSPPVQIDQQLPREGEIRKQRDTWKEVAEHSKHDSEAWHKVAEFELELRNPVAALEAEDKAIALFPKYAVAFATRARARFELKQWSACRADCSQVIGLMEAKGGMQRFLDLERPPSFYIASYRLRGLAWSWESKWDQALEDFASALKLDRNNSQLHRERAYLAEKAGRKADAAASWLRAGLLHLDAGDRFKAQEALAALDRLEARTEAGQLRQRLESTAPKSDLP
jgi:tetratricopeptide (TPR) repeat protein